MRATSRERATPRLAGCGFGHRASARLRKSIACTTTIGSYEAKTHLARLLDEVAQGKSVTITRRGQVVARLVPAAAPVVAPDEVIAALRAGRRGVRLGGSTARELIDEGRR